MFMISITKDVELVHNAVAPYPEMLYGFVADDWLKVDGNIALIDDVGNVGLLVKNKPGVYFGHYFFHTDATRRVRDMIEFVFTECPVEMLFGLTPVTRPAALYMNRKMGFTSHGILETPQGDCELVTLTRAEFFER